MNKVELLSPAGDYNCFLAAINSGADAVYLSGDKYGARAYAKNFTKEELISALEYAHIFGRKIFLTVNTLVKDDELSGLYDFLYPLYINGLDGVIVQDMGVITYIRRHFKDLPVHASTQLAVTGLEGIRLLEKEGVVRTVLAREVSLSEIRNIHNNSDMEIECFVHGALCYSYSGKCLFSSLVGGRSGNRGRCAGSCRQPYNDKYLLSTKDICCLSIIPDLIDAGIASFKIEGRMKSPEYVAGVTAIYRKYIDIYYAHCKKNSATEIKNKYFSGAEFNNDLDLLIKLYTRGGNSTGYYFKHNDRNMITIEDASYRSDKGEVKSFVSENILNNPDKIKVNGRIFISPGEKIQLSVNDEVFAEGAVVMTASNRPIDEDTVNKQLKKTGDTEFIFDKIDICIADNSFVRISDLNDIRRKAINLYRDSLLNEYRRTDLSKKTKSQDNRKLDNSASNSTLLSVEVSTIRQFETVADISGIYKIYVPYNLILENEDYILSIVKDRNIKLYVKFQSVIRYDFLEKNKERITEIIEKSDGVLADSLEVIEFISTLKENNAVIKNKEAFELVGDIHIYAFNTEACNTFKNAGVDTLTVPVELNKKELFRRGVEGEELIIYGYLPMMVSAQCVNNTLNNCDKKYKSINLKDRKGAIFTAVNDCSVCCNTIYNNVPLSLHSEGEFVKNIRPSFIRVIFTLENEERVKEITEFYLKLSYNGFNKLEEAAGIFKENTYTKGHINRGVM